MRFFRSTLLLLLIISLYAPTIHAKTKVVSAEYIYQLPENVSPDQAREIAITRARSQAIADEFGTNVNSRTSVVVENNGDNSHIDFFSLGGSELKGEWIEDIEKPTFEFITDGASMALKVKIKGRIREIRGSRVEPNFKILRNGIKDTNESDQFESEDDLYISFNSPTDGYLAIYLIDNTQNAFCLLPYPAQPNGIFTIKANEKYIFFHPDYAKGVNPSDVESLIVDTESTMERNRILVLFSPNKFFKGADTKESADLPRSMKLEEFQKWMSNLIKKDPDMTITERPIQITKK